MLHSEHEVFPQSRWQIRAEALPVLSQDYAMLAEGSHWFYHRFHCCYLHGMLLFSLLVLVSRATVTVANWLDRPALQQNPMTSK